MGHGKRRSGVAAAWFLGLVLTAAHAVALARMWPAAAQEPEASQGAEPQAEPAPSSCTKTEFEVAVDAAAEALRDLNNRNRPEFQNKLRLLKEKRSWTDDQFLKEAAPFVKDDRIGEFDARTNELLASISAMGTEGASAKVPDCAMLAELRRLMGVLIETQGSKWSYMFEKLDAELGE